MPHNRNDDLLPLGLGPQLAPSSVEAPAGVEPYPNAMAHLDGLVDVVQARAARAIADDWDSGRLGLPGNDHYPYEQEVNAIAGRRMFIASDQLTAADQEVGRLSLVSGKRGQASLAAGMRLPFIEITREHGLSNVEAQLLLVVVAPALRGEVARLYDVISNDETRRVIDPALCERIIAGDDQPRRREVAASIAPTGRLRARRLIQVGNFPAGRWQHAPLTVEPALIARLRGDSPDMGPRTMIREAFCMLDELQIPDDIKHDLLMELADLRADRTPVRIQLRGATGSGRRSLAAALAALVGRRIAVIDIGAGSGSGELLATDLARAFIVGAVPCVMNTAISAEHDSGLVAALAKHPGPVILCANTSGGVAVGGDCRDFVLPCLAVYERDELWRDVLERNGLHVNNLEVLVCHVHAGPAVIERSVAAVGKRMVDGVYPGGGDQTHDVTTELVQQLQSKASQIAGWPVHSASELGGVDELVLPAAVRDGVCAFIARMGRFGARQDGRLVTICGGIGTGKTSLARALAKELELGLLRVEADRLPHVSHELDVALRRIFDAAERSPVMLLLDDADELFTEPSAWQTLMAKLHATPVLTIVTSRVPMPASFERRADLSLVLGILGIDARALLWARALAEIGADGVDGVDAEQLAVRYALSGGEIARVASVAAELGAPITADIVARSVTVICGRLNS